MSNIIRNTIGHLLTVHNHRKEVRRTCFKMGLYLQGLTHDLSKYTPTELFESIRYWNGKISPINVCKEKNGISMAWLHHKGINKHHYEYWCDNFRNGVTCHKIPRRYLFELLADYLAAGKTYRGINSFTYKGELEWWLNESKNAKMESSCKQFVTECLVELSNIESSLKTYDIPCRNKIDEVEGIFFGNDRHIKLYEDTVLKSLLIKKI